LIRPLSSLFSAGVVATFNSALYRSISASTFAILCSHEDIGSNSLNNLEREGGNTKKSGAHYYASRQCTQEEESSPTIGKSPESFFFEDASQSAVPFSWDVVGSAGFASGGGDKESMTTIQYI
jgi:hypothetical protein